ncbi:MAG TPA: cytochrome c-type biogenesis protein [Caulobacteraceae bacterium]|jgi:cytochrome c-type biogenesis protein CcmH
MRPLRLIAAAAAVLCLAAAGDPSERLPDPAQEARARDLFAQVRCVVCQNESIDDSEAELAGDLRRAVREQVAAGRSDAQIKAWLVARYGDFVLLRPPLKPGTLVLWGAPFALLLGGGVWLLLAARRRRAETAELTAEESEALERLSQDQDTLSPPIGLTKTQAVKQP